MKLPDKLPTNMDEAKAMLKDLSDQVVAKVTELCNKGGKKPEVAPPPAPTEEKKAAPAEKKDGE